MANTTNSFTETVNNLVIQVNNAISMMNGMNTTLSTSQDTVSIPYNTIIDGEASIGYTEISSYNKITLAMDALQNTVDNFVSGKGNAWYKDGSTLRKIYTEPVPVTPTPITDLASPTEFTTRNNWFFETLMFPQVLVNFDLKDKIDDQSKRVSVKRVILDNANQTDDDIAWFNSTFVDSDTTYTYSEAKDVLDVNGYVYYEDDDVLDLPLNVTPYTGTFTITDADQETSTYDLDNFNYALTSDETLVYDQTLGVGDQLKYINSIFEITEVNKTSGYIKVIRKSGSDRPQINTIFSIYSDPNADKIVSIAVGHNELEIIFIKGVNPSHYLEGSQWGNGIPFYTNNLILADSTKTLEEYYATSVADIGSLFMGMVREKSISAFDGVTPNIPTLT